MPTVKDVYEHARWLIEHGRGDEKGILVLPRIESQRRRENKEQRKRIVMTTDPQNYSEFMTWREAYMLTLHENPTLCVQAIIAAMAAFDVKGWYEQHLANVREVHESLGDA